MSQQGTELTSVLFQPSTFSTRSLPQCASFVVKIPTREKKKQENTAGTLTPLLSTFHGVQVVKFSL